MDLKKLHILELPSEAGAGTRGASLGPKALLANAQQEQFHQLTAIPWQKAEETNSTIRLGEPSTALHHTLVLNALKSGYKNCKALIDEGKEPLILSGDHSNAAAGISAFSGAYGPGESAVIWIDAHADLHTPFTTPSGNMHGMPLGAMLGTDNMDAAINKPKTDIIKTWQEIKKLGNGNSPKLLAQHIVFLGIRDLEEPEWALIQKLGIKYYKPEDIAKKGIETILMEVESYLNDIPHWYTSFDVDSLDPSISVGTGTPVPNGLTKEQALTCFGYFFEHEKTKAFEITEINPLLDQNNKMAAFVNELLEAVLT